MDRAYSILTQKAVTQDAEYVYIEGVASTPTLDRMGDVVEPMGAKFSTPMPLIMQHDASLPVGNVTFAQPNSKGIPFKARLPIVKEAGRVKDRVDEAIHSLRYDLISAVSIGFKAVEGSVERLKSGGLRFKEWLWIELSLVTIPAQSEAIITSVRALGEIPRELVTQIKSIDTQQLAATGQLKLRGAVRLVPSPGVSGKTTPPRNPKGNEVKTIAEQIADLKVSRETKAVRIESIQTAATEGNVTKDASQREEFDTLFAEIESIDLEIKDLEKMERFNITKAAPIVAGGGAAAAAASARTPVNVKNTQKLEPGIALARYARCLLLAEGSKHGAAQIAKNQYPEMDWMVGMLDAEVGGLKKEQMFQTKAAVAGGNTTDATWAAPLVQYQQYAQEFVEFLRPQMIVGKFGTGGIPSLRRVPFNVTIGGMTSGASAGWVGEAAPKPVTKAGFTNVNLRWAKIAGITVISDELARMSTPGAEGLLRDEMAKAVIERADIDFIDPDKAAVTNVSPASIVNGVAPVASTGGNSAAEVRADIRALFGAWISGNVNPANAVFIMSPGTALAISLMYNDLDSARVFPGLTMNGGTLEGIPVIVSQYAANDGGSAGSLVILANASDIFLSEDAGVDIAVSREASIQMNDAPDNPATAATVFTSMFQTNQLAIRAELFINWAKRRTNAVAWMDSVSWGT